MCKVASVLNIRSLVTCLVLLVHVGSVFFLFSPGLSQTTQVAAVSLALLTAALSQPQIYGDERDGIIAKLNQLQACWGTGKGFYNQQGAVDFLPQNPFCRFKVSTCLYKFSPQLLVTTIVETSLVHSLIHIDHLMFIHSTQIFENITAK